MKTKEQKVTEALARARARLEAASRVNAKYPSKATLAHEQHCQAALLQVVGKKHQRELRGDELDLLHARGGVE